MHYLPAFTQYRQLFARNMQRPATRWLLWKVLGEQCGDLFLIAPRPHAVIPRHPPGRLL
jgi:hypothetical protein